MRWADLKAGTGSCRRCAEVARGEALATNTAVCDRLRQQASAAARAKPAKWSCEERRVAAVLSGARQRCTNKRNNAYPDYGARGIEFRFVTVEEATRWVVDNLGTGEGKTLDRIDNDRHYEPGNLRWATRTEQSRNRRAYSNRLSGLTEARRARPDLSDSQLRLMVKRGDTIETIRGWVKYASSRV